jgi:hypothetical protein
MLFKVLAWTCLAAALLFVALMLTAILARSSLGDLGPMLVYYGAVPLLGLGILLAVVLLITSAFSSHS